MQHSSRVGEHQKGHRIAYYCSGHGLGNGSRVAAFSQLLLRQPGVECIHIVSSAPGSIFDCAIRAAACYRFAIIDPVVAQPVAYRVDRKRSIQALGAFMTEKEQRLQVETNFLQAERITCVLSDSAFLGCLAAHQEEIPAVLITNFTFDSVYSYLAAPVLDLVPFPPLASPDLQGALYLVTTIDDGPIEESRLEPLVQEMLDGYRCADLLLRLPGAIPIPSFCATPALPLPHWVKDRAFHHDIIATLSNSLLETLTESVAYPSGKVKPVRRQIVDMRLLSRAQSPDACATEPREKILQSAGVAPQLVSHKIVVVSFGGQIIHKPGRPSRIQATPRSREKTEFNTPGEKDHSSLTSEMLSPRSPAPPILIGASPAISSPVLPTVEEQVELQNFIPAGWIAILCGVNNGWEGLPDRVFCTPRDVYMPDLTAVADVLLGKLGYGTVSECLSTGAPLVCAPRPLFIEEYGLRLILEREGVGVELSQEEYERGGWSSALLTAYLRGDGQKKTGVNSNKKG